MYSQIQNRYYLRPQERSSVENLLRTVVENKIMKNWNIYITLLITWGKSLLDVFTASASWANLSKFASDKPMDIFSSFQFFNTKKSTAGHYIIKKGLFEIK